MTKRTNGQNFTDTLSVRMLTWRTDNNTPLGVLSVRPSAGLSTQTKRTMQIVRQ